MLMSKVNLDDLYKDLTGATESLYVLRKEITSTHDHIERTTKSLAESKASIPTLVKRKQQLVQTIADLANKIKLQESYDEN